MKRRVLHANIIACSVDLYFFLMLYLGLQLELDLPFQRSIDIDAPARGEEAIFRDDKIDMTQLRRQNGHTILPGSGVLAVRGHFRVRYRSGITLDLHADCRLRLLGERQHGSEDKENREFEPHVLICPAYKL
jgi:hypothetical protein